MAFFAATRARSLLEPVGAAAPSEARGAGELAQECVAFGVGGVDPAEVGPVLGLAELPVDVAEPLPVCREGRLVKEVAEPRFGGAGGDEIQSGHGLSRPAQQLIEVAEAAKRPERCRCAFAPDQPQAARSGAQVDPARFGRRLPLRSPRP